MTIIDRPEPRTTAPDWSALDEAQRQARDTVSDFLDAPSTVAFGALLAAMNACLDVERRLIVTLAAAGAADAVAALEEQHVALSAALNAVTWETPGSATVWSRTSRLRHALLQQIEVSQRLARSLPATG